MYGLINKLLFKKQNTTSTIIDDEYHILFSYDKAKKAITLSIDYESILEQNNIDIDQDAENIASFFYNICNNKVLLASLVLDNLSEYKHLATEKAIKDKKSDSLLFVNSIISHLESILSSSKIPISNKDEPVIKPIQVFHNAN